MSFWSNFTHGFAHGAFDSMFGGFWGMPCGNWGMCCNQIPMFFTPSLFMGGFNRYVQPMVNVSQLPIVMNLPGAPQWPDAPMSGFDFFKTETPTFKDDVGFDTFDFSNTQKASLSWDTYFQTPTFASGNKKSEVKKDVKSAEDTKGSKNTKGKTGAKVKHWSKMSDEELKSVYGNYSRDITQPYKGSAADINKYLEGNGVLEGQGQAFIDAQNKYGISAAVLVGIAMFETGGGKSNIARSKNNVGGVRISGSKEFRKFDSVADCVMEMARFLKVGYAENSGRPLTKLYQVNGKYCPASETSGNSRWAKNIDHYASELENTATA